MIELKPIVYTRPFPRDDDFRFFARPETLKGNLRFEDRIVNALSTEGYRRGIQDRRWHVLQIQDSIIVGLATREFHRMDEYGRNVRGYYGFALPRTGIEKPDVTLFCELDKYIVEPLFREDNLEERDFGVLRDGVFADETLYVKLNDQKVGRRFNHDTAKVLYFPTDEPFEVLINDAILEAKKYDDFECVIGLNSRRHAEESKVQNCLCYDQPTALIVSLSQKPHGPEKIVAQKAETQRVRPARQGHAKSEPSMNDEGLLGHCWRVVLSRLSNPRQRDVTITGSKRSPLPQQPTPELDVEKHLRGWKIEPASSIGAKECNNVDGAQETPSSSVHGKSFDEGEFVEKLLRIHFQWNQIVCDHEKELCERLCEILLQRGAVQIDGDVLFDSIRHVDIDNICHVDGARIIETIVPGWEYRGKVIERAKVKVADAQTAGHAKPTQLSGDELIQEA